MPPIPEKDKCKAEAQELAFAIQLILQSEKYQDLIAAFEDPDLPTAKAKFVQTLNQIPNISQNIKGKLIAGAFSHNSVSFNWF